MTEGRVCGIVCCMVLCGKLDVDGICSAEKCDVFGSEGCVDGGEVERTGMLLIGFCVHGGVVGVGGGEGMYLGGIESSGTGIS